MGSYERFWEIDLARGVSVIAMICYHFYVIGKYPYTEQPLRWVAIIIASSFITISGISIRIAYNRGYRLKRFLLRSLKIGLYAFLITIGSYVFIGSYYVRFGILHFIAVGSLLVYPLFRFSYIIRGAISAGILLLHLLINDKAIGYWYTIPLGLYPKGFYSLDYFPIVPWLAVMLSGTVLSDLLYPNGKRSFRLGESKNSIVNVFETLGRHSLLIYVVHIPIIYVIWTLIKTFT